MFTCHHVCKAEDETSLNVPIGRPLPNVECRILDAQRQEVRAGAMGELYIGGKGALTVLTLTEETPYNFTDVIMCVFRCAERIFEAA